MIDPRTAILSDDFKRTCLIKTEAFVRARLEANACGHDFWHIHRVRNLALRIAPEAGADLFLVEMAALLHDVADPKLNASPEAGVQVLRDYLAASGLNENTQLFLADIIARISFGAGLDKRARDDGAQAGADKSPELMAVQDADRIDALGAVGIARTFAYGGSRGHAMHDPALPPRQGLTQAEYRGGTSTSINHFYEKLLKLKEGMNTNIGKALAEKRHAYMLGYLEQFKNEWDGIA